MSILKTNNAVGAYKSVLEWITKHFNVNIDEKNAESDIILYDGKYDISRSLLENWGYKWELRKISFSKDQVIQIPQCFSQTFLDRIETITLEDHDEFDPDSVKDFPVLNNLRHINCVVSGENDVYSFINKMCHLAKRINPDGRNIVNVDIIDRPSSDEDIQLATIGEKRYLYGYLNGESYIKCVPHSKHKVSVVEYNNVIKNYLYQIDIDHLDELVINSDYVISGKVTNCIRSNECLKKLVIKPGKMVDFEKNYKFSIIHCDMTSLDVPLNLPIEIVDSKIAGLKELMERCPAMYVDNRSKIKSGLGVLPISSQAIDMFGNFIHPNDVVAVPTINEIKWYKVLDVKDEKIRVIMETFHSHKLSPEEEYIYMDRYLYGSGLVTSSYRNSYRNCELVKIEQNGEILDALVMEVPDKICWKIDVSFLEKTDINKFYNKNIQMLKQDVFPVEKDPIDEYLEAGIPEEIEKVFRI